MSRTMTKEEAIIQLRLGPGINEDVSEEYNDAADIAIETLQREQERQEDIYKCQYCFGEVHKNYIYCPFCGKRIEELDQVYENDCDTCKHCEEIDGMNCYECVKGIRDNYEPTTEYSSDIISKQAVIDGLEYEVELCNRALDDMDIDRKERERFEWELELVECFIEDIRELPSKEIINTKSIFSLSEDLISRQAAIDAVHSYFKDKLEGLPTEETEEGYEVYCDVDKINALLSDNKYLAKRIENLPSAQLEHEIDGDTISRQAAIEAVASRDETNGTVKVFTGRQVNEILAGLPFKTNENLISRQDVMNKLKEMQDYISYKIFCAENNPTEYAEDYIRNMEQQSEGIAHVEHCILELPSVDRPKWIPCSERLPNVEEEEEEAYEVLCCDTQGNQVVAHPYKENEYSNTGFCAESEGYYLYDCVAWMPLPKPYNGGGEE